MHDNDEGSLSNGISHSQAYAEEEEEEKKMMHNLSRQTGFDLRSMIRTIKETKSYDTEQRREIVRLLSKQIHLALEYQTTMAKRRRCCSFYRHYLCALYFCTKLAYLLNVTGQFYLLNIFLSFSFSKLGIDWLNNRHSSSADTSETFDTAPFPRVVLCDFMIRQLGSNNHCVRRLYVKRYLQIANRYGIKSDLRNDKYMLDQFVYDYLKFDGVIVIKILGKNTNDVVMTELIAAMFDKYLQVRTRQIETTTSSGYRGDDQI
ncbi:unnamed protein product [Didymodactylos carnosus]|uniref:Uncharacterized protein n=1 Tax=Didymodactylos carnosus TaxID=1234261 RepID=A0A814YNF3_9BILA|nr:unnamed protein product [Didymodactylos carnosus]CAF1232066.1 unnamed protein product [Didymodactylos carnosus]CAF3534863.1 unnamed protein product [Didymodactylos carnosus]CAF3994691.1 unnamed protein product [Didymodactylos carnosus]